MSSKKKTKKRAVKVSPPHIFVTYPDFEREVREAITPSPGGFYVQASDGLFGVPHVDVAAAVISKISPKCSTSENESWDCDEAAIELWLQVRKKLRKTHPKPWAIGWVYANQPMQHAWCFLLAHDDAEDIALYRIQPGDPHLKKQEHYIQSAYFAHL